MRGVDGLGACGVEELCYAGKVFVGGAGAVLVWVAFADGEQLFLGSTEDFEALVVFLFEVVYL